MKSISNFRSVEKSINSLVESIMQDKFLNPEVVKQKAEIFLLSSLRQLIKESSTDLEKTAIDLKKTLAAGQYDYNPQVKQSKMMRLGSINDQIKFQNRAQHTIKDYDDYSLLKMFVVNKFGQDVLDEFYSLSTDERVSMFQKRIKVAAKELVYRKDRKDTVIKKHECRND